MLQYVRSSPRDGHDSLGLNYYISVDWMDTLINGWTVYDIATRLFQEYAENQEADFEWASDWSQGDDWYSSSGQYDYYNEFYDEINQQLAEQGLEKERFASIRGMSRALSKAASYILKNGGEVNRIVRHGVRGSARIWDGVKKGADGLIKVAMEIKSTRIGHIKSSARLKHQIDNDIFLVNKGETPLMEWHFISRSRNVTSITADPKVRQWLKDAVQRTGGKFKVFGLVPPI